MPNQIVHWVGENPSMHNSSMNNLVLTELAGGGADASPGGKVQITADVSRFGNNSFYIGTDDTTLGKKASLRDYTGNLPVIGESDFTISFWWKPTSDAFYSWGGNHKYFINAGGNAITNYANNGYSQTNYDVRWYYPYYHANGNTPAKGYMLDLTGLPWVHFFISRSGNDVTFILSDENGDVFLDNANQECRWTGTLAAVNKKNLTPTEFSLGGFWSATGNSGYYDDILYLVDEALDYDTLDLTQPLSISGEPFVTAVVSNASAGQSDGSVTVTDSNFSGTKTYTFYDSDLNILQQGISNTLNGLQANSYTIQVSDTNNNQVSTQFIISEGGNNMSIKTSSSAVVLSSDLESHAVMSQAKVTYSDGTDVTLSGALSAIAASGMANVEALGLMLSDEIARANLAEAAIQADVDANEADGDTDRALIRTEMAAADGVVSAAFAAADTALGGRMDDMLAGAATEAFTTVKLVNPLGGFKTLAINAQGELEFA